MKNFVFKNPSPIYIVIGVVVILLVLVYAISKTKTSGDIIYSQTTTSVPTKAIIETNYGSIEITFLNGKATSTISNFISLADKGFYDGTKFHRVIRDFMIQGGDPNTKTDDVSSYGTGGPGYIFNDEINDEMMVRSAVAMANSGSNTNGSQFFIVTAVNAPWIQGKHTIFAKVTKGIQNAINISKVSTVDKFSNRPVKPVIVKKIILI